jgi:hypothetical protein
MTTDVQGITSLRARASGRALFAVVAAALALGGCKPKAQTTEPAPAPVQPTPTPTPEPTPEPVAKAPERVYPDPPPPGPARPFNFPATSTFTLPNGLAVYVVENHEVPVVAMQLAVRAGTMDAQQVADFTAVMLGEGTKTRTKAKMDEAIEFVGGRIGGGATVHVSSVGSRVLKPHL